ncbi:rubredoxin, partial [Hominenteromicrobium sp.]|uniref:rubredoxin n=1 Tax=Hominenteromicrobium sp. TaxID=3073581 RepID=UPI003A918111
ENTCCWFLCKVISGMDVGQEMVFAAENIAGSDSAIGTPMTYDFYRSEMHGLSPVGSPTYVPPESTFDKSSGESFVCSVCGYVYSDPNFSFEELPDNWVCPVCKMPKKAFVRRN